MQSLKSWILANKIAAFVVFMHLLLIVGFQSGMDRTKSASNMGDTVVANLLDANPQKEKSTVSRPTPVKPVEKKKVEATPTPVTTTTGSFTPPNQEPSLPSSSLGGSSNPEYKIVLIDQANTFIPKPFYPTLSKRMGDVGQAKIRVYVSELGAVEEVKLVQSSGHYRLDQAALEAAKKAKFTPYVEMGKTIKIQVIIPYVFILE
jgi:periplasmic protein TonB